VAHLRDYGYFAHGIGNAHLANIVFPNLVVQAQLVAAGAAVALEADVDVLMQGLLYPRHIAKRDTLLQQEERYAPVHGPGIEVGVVQGSGNGLSSSAFAAGGVAVNGNDEVFHKHAGVAIGPARLRNPGLLGGRPLSQPPRHRRKKSRYRGRSALIQLLFHQKKWIKKKLTRNAHARGTVGAGGPLAVVGAHQALAQVAAHGRAKPLALGRSQAAALRVDDMTEVRHGLAAVAGQPELLAHLFGSGGESDSLGRLVGHARKN
jgi:hypothetical protein